MKRKSISKKRFYDRFASTFVYGFGLIGVLILAMVITYVSITGINLVKWDTIIGDSQTINTNVFLEEGPGNYEATITLDEDIYYTEAWGLGLINTTDREGHKIVEVAYIHPDSPFINSLDKNNQDENGDPRIIEVKNETALQSVILDGFTSFGFYTDGAEVMRDLMDQATQVNDLTVQIVGGGIRGSIYYQYLLVLLQLFILMSFLKNQNSHQLYGV